MYIHDLDPVIVNFGLLEIRWYSVAYILGILIGWWLGKKIIIKKSQNISFDVNEFDNLITYLIISMILGGRLGYVIFYNPYYYFLNPLDIFKIWQGGMSFHGALLGIIIGTYIFSIKKKTNLFYLLDIIACVSPIGIFFGRIANFINGELIGKATNVYWGVIFPKIDNIARHPSQLYEAFLEGVILFFIMNFVLFKDNYKIGNCSYMFLIIYGILRIFSEIFRQPDPQIGYILGMISMGTLLSALMIVSGLILFYFRKNES